MRSQRSSPFPAFRPIRPRAISCLNPSLTVERGSPVPPSRNFAAASGVCQKLGQRYRVSAIATPFSRIRHAPIDEKVEHGFNVGVHKSKKTFGTRV